MEDQVIENHTIHFSISKCHLGGSVFFTNTDSTCLFDPGTTAVRAGPQPRT